MLDACIGLDLAVVEPVGGEFHDGIVHAVLHFEQGDGVGLILHDAFHERLAESLFHGLVALDGGWKLLVVAGKDDA